jgi:hypothetical protein
MHRFFLGVVFVMIAVAPQVASGAAPQRSLTRGEAVFWDGPHVEEGSGKSWTYRLEVTERAYRLRIGIDHPEVYDVYEVVVTDPKGDRWRFSPGTGLYSAEMMDSDPAVGTWKVEVTAEDVTDSAFRMRAKLEARPPSLGVRKGAVLPNLQVLPPHIPSFLFPVTNGAGDQEPTGIDTNGGDSCHAEEHEEGAVRCLRFAFGVRNTGRGPMSLRIGPGGQTEDRDLFQIIERVNGSTFERPAGVAKFHESHGHYHHDAAMGLQLFSVSDPDTGELEEAGEKRTKGFAHREELLRDWEHFYPTGGHVGFGLGPGWSDIYEWDRPGNYIDFGVNTDGRYVIRMWADPVEGIRESNEKDNVGYSYIEVKGDTVELLEVGRGSDPWDECKIMMGAGGHPDPAQGSRPASCPRDTT